MDSLVNREFAASASPLNWYEVAKLMHENAHVLHKSQHGYVSYKEGDMQIFRPASNRPVFLLAAFAIENLVKAFIIYENPHYIEGGKLSRELLNGHSLTKLQEKSRKIPQPKRTRHILDALEVGVNSWARYPCSTSIERQSLERVITPELWSEYNRVFDLYSKKLEALLSKKHKGAYGQVGYVKFKNHLDL